MSSSLGGLLGIVLVLEVTLPGAVAAQAAAAESSWTLPRMVDRVLRTYPSLRSATESWRVAQGVTEERGWGFVPRIELIADYTRLSPVDQPELIEQDEEAEERYRQRVLEVDDVETRAAFTALSDTFTDTSLPVVLDRYRLWASVALPLSGWFVEVLPRYRAARGFEAARRHEIRTERAAVALLVHEAYYAWVAARAVRDVAEATLLSAETDLERVQVLFQAGEVAAVARLRAEAFVARARVGVSRARGRLARWEQNIRILLQLEPGEPLTIVPPDLTRVETVELPGTTQQMEAQALAHRPEALAMRAMIEAEGHSVRAAGSDLYPSLDLQVHGGLISPNPRVFPQKRELSPAWDVVAALSWSPSDMLVARARKSQTKSRRDRLVADLDTWRVQMRQQLSQHSTELMTQQETREAARLAVRAAEESYRIQQMQLEDGAALITDVLDSHRELVKAQLAYVRAHTGVGLASARLQQALGTLVPP